MFIIVSSLSAFTLTINNLRANSPKRAILSEGQAKASV